MAIVRTTLQTIAGLVILLAILLWLFSPTGPLADRVELAPAGGPAQNRIRIIEMKWSSDATTGLSLCRGDVDGGNIVVWHQTAGDCRSQIVNTGENQVWKAALAPDGEVAFVFGDSGSVSRIALGSKERAGLFRVPPESALTEMATSADGAILAMAIEKEIILCDTSTGRVIDRFEPSSSDTHSMAFSGDGRLLAIGSDAGAVQVWDHEKLSLVRHYSNHRGPVTAVEFLPDRRLVTVGLIDDTLHICDLDSGETLGRIITGHCGSRALAVSPDGGVAATGGNDRTILLWNLKTLAQLDRFEGHTGVISALKFSVDGRELLSAGDSTIRTWHVESPSIPGGIESIVPSSKAD